MYVLQTRSPTDPAVTAAESCIAAVLILFSFEGEHPFRRQPYPIASQHSCSVRGVSVVQLQTFLSPPAVTSYHD